jgi:hypothetical protein
VLRRANEMPNYFGFDSDTLWLLLYGAATGREIALGAAQK